MSTTTPQERLRAAQLYLAATDARASWEYPGWIMIPHPSKSAVFYAVGDANGRFQIDIVTKDMFGDVIAIQPLKGRWASFAASFDELVDWIVEVLAAEHLKSA